MAENFDDIIHQRVRLQVMAALNSVEEGDEVDFTFLRKRLGVTDGNLGAHLQKLEDAAYLAARKTFVGKRPKTFLAATPKGRRAYQQHITTLQQWLQPSDS